MSHPRKIKRYGWLPDLPDQRDLLYSAPAEVREVLPPLVDLRPQCPPVYDQGDLGSCTAQAIAGAIEFDQRRQGLPEFTPSRLFIYYNERVIEDSVEQDAGAMARDGIKAVAALGAPPETDWIYDVDRFADRPPERAYRDAEKHRIARYERLPRDLDHMKGCLASGFPIIFGFSVYESFESQEVRHSGRLDMPEPDERVIGGHAVIAVGYVQRDRRFIVRNSWGPGFGMDGYFTMPYDYLLERRMSADFWTIRLVR
ncbi:MAG TPA: C1 family peptidase [Candidatus Dormibacteraeota bacterium]|nr:C1 family peptidase [Candidatus Dormibacteraeota bacterium]